MATFTVTISDLMGDRYDSDVKAIGLDDYPIFDNGYRPTLNEKIVGRFWFREIGFETESMFRHYMRQRMREIMPYYNELYQSTLVDFDMFSTVDLITVGADESKARGEGKTTSNAESTSSSNSKARAVTSETPQGLLSETGDYATAAQDSVSETGSDSGSSGVDTSENDQTARSESTSSTRGTQGSKSALLAEFRNTIINVDAMVLGQLEDLFFTVWSSGDDFSSVNRIYPPAAYQYPFYFPTVY